MKKNYTVDPDHALASYNLGCALVRLKRIDEAISAYTKAVKLKPNYTEAATSLGFLYNQKGNYDKSLHYFKLAALASPATYWVFANLAAAYAVQKQPLKTIANLEKCLKLNPDSTSHMNLLYMAYRRSCLWQQATKWEKILDEKDAYLPFVSLVCFEDSDKNLKAAAKYSQTIMQDTLKMLFSYPSLSAKKIRLGYLSGDFKDHPVGHLIVSLFRLHDRKKFEVSVFSYGSDDKSHWRKKVEKEADKFFDISFDSAAEAAQKINKNGIDILIDLTGHTQGSRLGICALKPSPVQVLYLGYPGTSGASFFDYAVADQIVVPKKDAQYYSEKLVYMPHCYQINDCNQNMSIKHFSKSDFNLPKDSFVFVSFVQPYKIEPVIFTVWMDILKNVPKSVLWLWKHNDQVEKNLKKEAEKCGIDPERLVFSAKLPKKEHLKRLGLADIALDTRIYGGHTTTSDCLRAGVPVITIKGSHFASRVAASILATYGVPELITTNLEEYKNLAIELALNPEKLRTTNNELRTNKLTSSLFDTKRFAGNLEKAYVKMWQTYLAGGQPEGFEVKE